MTPSARLPPRHRRRRPGLTPRQERFFTWLAAGLVVAVTTAWILGLWDAVRASEADRSAPTPGKAVGSALLDSRSRTTAYLSDADVSFLDVLRGRSGKVRAAFKTPGEAVVTEPEEEATAHYEMENGAAAAASPDFKAPDRPGVYKLAVELNKAQKEIDDLRVITLVPFQRKEQGRIGLYYLGNWPFEGGGRPPSTAYGNPDGFVEVTRENKDLAVSEHFRLGDFLTKDQPNVWPKYMLLDPRLLDKLELVIDELNRQGYDVKHLTVMSGFRTPRYNKGGGNTTGRANLSRHMYGDASDVFVDNDRDGWTDDVNRDGKVDVKDSEIVARAAERVEAQNPALVGGIGIYTACCGHGPFTHVDVRGRRARWRGTGNG
jgi:uncharacterized protein YcbK (DUF882 family)